MSSSSLQTKYVHLPPVKAREYYHVAAENKLIVLLEYYIDNVFHETVKSYTGHIQALIRWLIHHTIVAGI